MLALEAKRPDGSRQRPATYFRLIVRLPFVVRGRAISPVARPRQSNTVDCDSLALATLAGASGLLVPRCGLFLGLDGILGARAIHGALAASLAAQEVNFLDDDLYAAALRAVFGFPAGLLQTPGHGQLVALQLMMVDDFGQLAEGHQVEVVHVFGATIVDGKREVTNGLALAGVANFRVADEVPDEHGLVHLLFLLSPALVSPVRHRLRSFGGRLDGDTRYIGTAERAVERYFIAVRHVLRVERLVAIVAHDCAAVEDGELADVVVDVTGHVTRLSRRS